MNICFGQGPCVHVPLAKDLGQDFGCLQEGRLFPYDYKNASTLLYSINAVVFSETFLGSSPCLRKMKFLWTLPMFMYYHSFEVGPVFMTG